LRKLAPLFKMANGHKRPILLVFGCHSFGGEERRRKIKEVLEPEK
jgi:hypothetical protein